MATRSGSGRGRPDVVPQYVAECESVAAIWASTANSQLPWMNRTRRSSSSKVWSASLIGLRLTDLVKHGLQRGKIPVDVIERSDPHDPPPVEQKEVPKRRESTEGVVEAKGRMVRALRFAPAWVYDPCVQPGTL